MTFNRSFPTCRLRRLRAFPWMRSLVAETHLSIQDLILPIFVTDASHGRTIPSLPGIHRETMETLPFLLEQVSALGIPAVALFPVVTAEKKCPLGLEALDPKGLIPQAIACIQSHAPQVGIITDPALDAYTDHGHDGVLNHRGEVDNDASLERLAQNALCQAQAGAHIIAPSDMMDGRIQAIRNRLDIHGYGAVALLSYAAKFASAFYGPFRHALGSDETLKNQSKATYHMDMRSGGQAMEEMALDLQEGADMLMIKPGLTYLDVISRASQTFQVPILGYHVSGEYAMLKAAADQGWISYDQGLMETLMAFKRAGACGIFTYGALDAAKILKGDSHAL